MRSASIRFVSMVVLSVACAQPRPSTRMPPGMTGDPDPVAAIIERRPQLSLADSQVATLRVLKRELDRVNRPLREELERLGYFRPLDNARRLPAQPTKEQQEKSKPIVDEMRANNRKARNAALEILTLIQRTKLDSLEKLSQRDGQRPRSQPSP